MRHAAAPRFCAPKSYTHLSVISAITSSGRLFVRIRDRSFRGPDVVGFLKHLQRHLSSKLLIVWDGAKIHRGQAVQRFLAEGGAERLQLERLPAYAPELTPDEGIWHSLKYVEMRNLICPTIADLRYELRLAIARLRHKPHVIRGCISQTRL
jgi:transposase